MDRIFTVIATNDRGIETEVTLTAESLIHYLAGYTLTSPIHKLTVVPVVV